MFAAGLTGRRTGLLVVDHLGQQRLSNVERAQRHLAVDERHPLQEPAGASQKAIDDAADGGGFILSTGDQCGRDTPEQNILALVETARTHGVY